MTVPETLTPQDCGCDSSEHGLPSTTVSDALRVIREKAHPVEGSETLQVSQAKGRVLAENVVAQSNAPPFDNAAMDGYALSTSSLDGDGPWKLAVASRVPAGQVAGTLPNGQTAAQIFTGAPVPKGANAVIMQEKVRRSGDAIWVNYRPPPGQHIRRTGSDMRTGDLVRKSGDKLDARSIAACAAAGQAIVTVRRPVKVALLVTGDELRGAGKDRTDAQIWDVNTPMLLAAIENASVDIFAAKHGGDTEKEIARRFGDMAQSADLIVTSGGISVGSKDYVKPALRAAGGEIFFSGVAIKPGKPVSFGKLGNALWLGLPGNPLSSYVIWQVFGETLSRRLSGRTDAPSIPRRVCLGKDLTHKPGRCEFRLAKVTGSDNFGRHIVDFEDVTHSGRVSGLSAADGLVYIPAHIERLPKGALAEYKPFA